MCTLFVFDWNTLYITVNCLYEEQLLKTMIVY